MKMTSKLAIAAVCGMLLFSSVNFTVEAAAKKSAIDYTMKGASGESKVLEEELARLDKEVQKNGGTYCVFVDNKKTKSKGPEVFWYGNVKQQFQNYDDYMKKVAGLKGAALQRPTDLPEEYAFVEAGFLPYLDQNFKANLRAEAQKSGKVVLSKKYNWNKSESMTLKFANDKNYVKLNFYDMGTKHATNKKEYTYYPAKKGSGNKAGENQLIWVDKALSCNIYTNADNPMTKEELITLAESMIVRK